MIPSEIRSTLEAMGRGANKRLGQHFLIDKATLQAVADAAEVKAGDRVFEIGPGLGVLTGELLKRGAKVISIERDRGLASYLRGQYASQLASGQFLLLEGDAADGTWLEHIGTGEWKFVSNLPYAITSLALRLALWSRNPPTHLSVLIQKEVADRIVDRQKTSLLSLMVQLCAREYKIVRRVPPGAFYPPPKVDSAVLLVGVLSSNELLNRWSVSPERVMAVAKRGFAHPRKMLFSNLGCSAEEKTRLVQARYSATVRAEALSVEEWVKLVQVLGEEEKDVGGVL